VELREFTIREGLMSPRAY